MGPRNAAWRAVPSRCNTETCQGIVGPFLRPAGLKYKRDRELGSLAAT